MVRIKRLREAPSHFRVVVLRREGRLHHTSFGASAPWKIMGEIDLKQICFITFMHYGRTGAVIIEAENLLHLTI